MTTLEYADAWDLALEQLLICARDSAEFERGGRLGRSRTVSLRKLGAAVRRIDELQAVDVAQLEPELLEVDADRDLVQHQARRSDRPR